MDQKPISNSLYDVEFQELFYTVKKRKNLFGAANGLEILHGVSGSFRNGELSAILGPSGSGKSSLLNALSGLKTSGIVGNIKTSQKNSCYIMQEDSHQALFTVDELMNLSGNLRLANSRKQIKHITIEILKNLNLLERRHIMAKNLSGGERKRLSIALELVANPDIFFLDEPTSGLDEVNALQCIRLLSRLARQGRTVVCTIHQPSVTVFNYFDSVLVLARGQCVYQGPPSAVLPFLKYIEFECPKIYSPSDYLIELCDVDDGKHISRLSSLMENGKLKYVPTPNSSVLCHADFKQSITTTLFPAKSKVGNYTENYGSRKNTNSYEKYSYGYKELQVSSGYRQFRVLLAMMLLRILRGRIPLLIQFGHHFLCGLIFGLMFFNSGNQSELLFVHIRIGLSTMVIILYTQIMVPILSYPFEVKIVKKDIFNRWYSLMPYYCALTISRIPLQIILNSLLLIMIYGLSGLPLQWWRFALFVLIGLMMAFITEGLGFTIGALFNITNGSIIGSLTTGPITGVAVYGMDFAAQLPKIVRFILNFSYLRVAADALYVTILGFDRADLDCYSAYCHYKNPKMLLRFLDLEKLSVTMQFVWLVLTLLFFRLTFYISLRVRCCN